MTDRDWIECWDCHGYDVPCDTCGGARKVRARHVTPEEEDEITREISSLLGTDDTPEDDY